MFLTNDSDYVPFGAMNKAVGDVASLLRTALADVVTFYTRAHGFHWNVKGSDFAQYHELFESIYEDVYSSIDPMAENMLKLGVDAPFKLSDFIAYRTLPETTIGSADDPRSMASDLQKANLQLINTLNMAFASANSSNEQGIANFLAERIDMHKKWDWQLRSSLGM